MKIPFSIEEFFRVFGAYNVAVWPVQIFLNILAISTIILIQRNGKSSSRIAFVILFIFWIWMGLGYHIYYFSAVNKAAYLFGVLFVLQGIGFFYFGAIKERLELRFSLELHGIVGMVFIFYSLIAYPLLGYFGGHRYPLAPTFGVPCPTTIFTFGVLLFSRTRISWYIILVPFLWSLVGFWAAINLAVKEDFGLVVAGVLSTIILLFYKPKGRTEISYKSQKSI
jgi:Family of unknown function (DUF6064)